MVSQDHLRLHFSEPLAPVDGVDPNDFRMSMGMAKSYLRYAYTYYYDPGELQDGAMNFTRMQAQGDIIDLYFEPPFDIQYCHELATEMAEMDAEPGVSAKGGFYLHYSPGNKPITDSDGNALAPIGPEWVLRKRRGGDEAYDMYLEGAAARRALRGLIPVDCGVPVSQ